MYALMSLSLITGLLCQAVQENVHMKQVFLPVSHQVRPQQCTLAAAAMDVDLYKPPRSPHIIGVQAEPLLLCSMSSASCGGVIYSDLAGNQSWVSLTAAAKYFCCLVVDLLASHGEATLRVVPAVEIY